MSASPKITILGLGPAGLDRLPGRLVALVDDPGVSVVARTRRHPAARELAERRPVVFCDDLYERAEDFDSVYAAVADRVIDAAGKGPVAFVVPGSAVVGERSVPMVVSAARVAGIGVAIEPGESFLDLVYVRAGIDPITDGVQVIDGRSMPEPLSLYLPTVITQVDRGTVVGDVAVALGRVLPAEARIAVARRLGSPDESFEWVPLGELPRVVVDERTTLVLDRHDVGWNGLVLTNRLLRSQCPWDREQTHHSLVSHLIEETYEVVEALSSLDPEAPAGNPDFGTYADVEEELGDLLLQVVFHATLAAEAGAFGVEEIAEGIRRKLVRRHPHVFGDVEADSAEKVISNWEALKRAEKERESLMDDVPGSLPALGRAEKVQRRAASVGFDWRDVEPVLAKVREELVELEEVLHDPAAAGDELGDLLFAAVNLARHLDVDPELALRRSVDRFGARFRGVERLAAERGIDLAGAGLAELDRLWVEVKDALGRGEG